MKGMLQGFYHFAGTSGYGLLKIDGEIKYKIYDLKLLDGWNLSWNSDLDVPIPIDYEMIEDKIISIKKRR